MDTLCEWVALLTLMWSGQLKLAKKEKKNGGEKEERERGLMKMVRESLWKEGSIHFVSIDEEDKTKEEKKMWKISTMADSVQEESLCSRTYTCT